MNKKQKKFVDEVNNKYANDPRVNIFPKGMTDADALQILTRYILGENWYVVNPLSPDQVNVERVLSIITKVKVR